MASDNLIVIANGNAGQQQTDLVKEIFANHLDSIRWTESAEHARRVALQAAQDQVNTIVVAGGDGTINEVASALSTHDGDAPAIGIIPLGTGNDLCRSLSLPDDPKVALEVIQKGTTRRVDLGALTVGDDKTHSFLNVSSAGFSGEVDKCLEETDKTFWGPLSYFKSGLEALKSVKPLDITLRTDTTDCQLTALNLIVANGRYAAAGIPVAPQAYLNDGLLDVIVYLGDAAIDQLKNASAILTGNQLESDNIFWTRTRELEVVFNTPTLVNIDGDLIDGAFERLSYSLVPKKLKVLTRGAAEALV